VQTAAAKSQAQVPVQANCARALQGAGAVTSVQALAIHAQLPEQSDFDWMEVQVTNLSSHRSLIHAQVPAQALCARDEHVANVSRHTAGIIFVSQEQCPVQALF